MAELTAAQKEINRRLAESGLPPRFPESSGDQTTPKTSAGLKELGAQLLRGSTKEVEDNKKLNETVNGLGASTAIGSPLPPAILDSGSAPTPDKTFFDNLDSTFSGILGGLNIPSKYGGAKLEEAADKLPKQSEYTPIFDTKDSSFGTPMSSRSTSSLSGSVGKLGEKRSLGTPASLMRKEARRLRNLGYKEASEQMALQDSMQRLNEPSIMTQEQRGRREVLSKQAGVAEKDAMALQGEQTQYMRDLLKARQKQLNEGVMPPSPVGQTTAPNENSLFGTPMGSRSTSSLSGSVGRLGEKRTFGTT